MAQNQLEMQEHSGSGSGPASGWEPCESLDPDKVQRCSACSVADDLTINGNWSQSPLCRSWQRAELLFRSTLNPGLRWLFHNQNQSEEEKNFVAAHNLVSRSSARLQRLQQSLLTVAVQWQLVNGAQTGSPKVCVKGLQDEGNFVLLPSSSSLQQKYRSLWKLLEQRSALLFIHEYTRRVRLAAVFLSRVRHLLELLRRKSGCGHQQNPFSSCPFRVSVSSLSQELRVHLNHWFCLLSKVRSDPYLRRAIAHHIGLMERMKWTLDLLCVQVLVLMEQYVKAILSAVGQTSSESLPREVLEDILAGTELYSQAVEEHRVQHKFQWQADLLLQVHHFTVSPRRVFGVPQVVSAKELISILATHQAETAVSRLLHCTFEQACQVCGALPSHGACSDDIADPLTLRSKWTWEQMQNVYLISSPSFNNNQPSVKSINAKCKTCPTSVLDHRLDTAIKECQRQSRTCQCQISPYQNGLSENSVEMSNLFHHCPPNSTTSEDSGLPQTTSASPPSFHHSSAELLFQVLVSSSDLLVPPVPYRPTEEPAEHLVPVTAADVLNWKAEMVSSVTPVINTNHLPVLNGVGGKVSSCHNVEAQLPDQVKPDQIVEGRLPDQAELDLAAKGEVPDSSGPQRDDDSDKHGRLVTTAAAAIPHSVRWSPSVQWLDLGRPLVLADLLDQYHTLVRTQCSKAFWLKLHMPPSGGSVGSINLQDELTGFQILDRITRASETGLLPQESRMMLQDVSVHALILSAHAHWDQVMCKTLSLSLKDKCFRSEDGDHVTSTSEQERGRATSVTMEHFLRLPPPLLSSVRLHSDSPNTGVFCLQLSSCVLQRRTTALLLASAQTSFCWLGSKALQFLSSWNLPKFLLITQGDFRVWTESFHLTVLHTKTQVMNLDQQSSICNHRQDLLRQQLEVLEEAVSELKNLSSLVLRTFSIHCKRASKEIFENSMPAAVHWRTSHRRGSPSSPSAYATHAAQSIIGQVLEGVALLSDDARVQALTVTMTAFMEAWMEHILQKKIKFSLQGALQLKVDFDSVRDMIHSERSGLSADLHQRLLSLRVFQQVDSAVMCLLQQPQNRRCLCCNACWAFSHCCSASRKRDNMDSGGGASITNLGCMETEDPPVMTADLPPVDPSSPAEPYLVPSAALGSAQQDWLDLRIQSGTIRWRLLGLECLCRTEL